MKTCFKCGQEKPLSDFYVHPQMGDGHLNKCKDCTKRDVQAHKDAHYEEVLERKREYSRSQRAQELRERYARQHPDRVKARLTVRVAVYQGRLKKGTCEVCGSSKTEGHHEDYSKPLDVRWFCRLHHVAVHRSVAQAI